MPIPNIFTCCFPNRPSAETRAVLSALQQDRSYTNNWDIVHKASTAINNVYATYVIQEVLIPDPSIVQAVAAIKDQSIQVHPSWREPMHYRLQHTT